jgi:DNA-directed RNA polymerase subunit M/transcription elongation factor TFIIS
MSKRKTSDPTLFAVDPLPSERCPGCGHAHSAVLWAQDLNEGMLRTYRCTLCGAKWSVDGRQQDFGFDVEPAALRMEEAS